MRGNIYVILTLPHRSPLGPRITLTFISDFFGVLTESDLSLEGEESLL